MAKQHSSHLEPCAAEYTALVVPVPDAPFSVFITAQGMHPTTGYEVQFHRSPIDVYPPEFSLWHIQPTGPVLEVLTPFTKFISFDLQGDVKEVFVTDANGRHKVELRQIGKTILHR